LTPHRHSRSSTPRPASITYSGSSAHPVSYTYDANGNKTGITDATGTSSYLYDPFDELTTATNGAQQTTGYGYDADGQPATITYPLPATATWATSKNVSYGYDNAGVLTSVTDFTGNKITITPSPDGLPGTQSLGSSGDTITTSYDNTDAPSAITLKNSSTTLQSFTYSDAPSGDILTETDTPSSPTSPAAYTYDTQSRVTSMTPGTAGQHSYGFDASSNLTTLPNGATGTYDKAGELTSAALSGTTTSYAYNADGERLTATQNGTTTASGTWNGAGQLTSYSASAANMTAASYDGNGMRASTTTTPTGGPAVTQGYVWNTVPGVPQLLMDSTNAYIYERASTPAEQVSLATGAITYLMADSLGSVRGTVGSSGTLTATTSYDAWGNPQTTGGLTSVTPFGFTGGYTDPTGLIYLINRYYDPATGQFTSVDPRLADTQEPYIYADGDPVELSDPEGLATVNLAGVAAWARQNYNTHPHLFGGDNCTDFASTALNAGGGDPQTRFQTGVTSNDHYWYFLTAKYIRWYSHSWAVAHDLAEHLNLVGSHWLQSIYQARPGYIVFGALYGGGFSSIDHTGVIVGMSGSGPTVAQQTRNVIESLLKWKQLYPATNFWIARPNAG
jgi:RHS repeat-associated protein